jgi:hypothetical protein
VGVVGSAGRGPDAPHLSPRLLRAMEEVAACVLAQGAVLASGGAALADHVAVRLFLGGRVSGLRLYLPARLLPGGRYEDRGPRSPGAVSNRHHGWFSRACGVDSFAELEEAVRRGAEVLQGRSFLGRNAALAADVGGLVAMTFGRGHAPAQFRPGEPGFADPARAGLADGGTADTWRRPTPARWKLHIPLGPLAGLPFQEAPRAAGLDDL